jgi:hypothetical protein
MRALFEKVIVSLLDNKLHAFLFDTKMHYCLQKSPPLDPIVNQINLVHKFTPYLCKINFNMILPSTSRLPKLFLPSIFPN